jgi:hypothetical protein
VLAVAIVLAVVACDGSGGETTIGYTGASDDCLANATAQGADQARAAFPDYPGVEWSTTARTITSQGYADVEVTPDPLEVGYPTFRFYSACNGDVVTLLAVFVPAGDGWELLFKTDEGAGIDFEAPTG